MVKPLEDEKGPSKAWFSQRVVSFGFRLITLQRLNRGNVIAAPESMILGTKSATHLKKRPFSREWYRRPSKTDSQF
jgi:hypothetical protein